MNSVQIYVCTCAYVNTTKGCNKHACTHRHTHMQTQAANDAFVKRLTLVSRLRLTPARVTSPSLWRQDRRWSNKATMPRKKWGGPSTGTPHTLHLTVSPPGLLQNMSLPLRHASPLPHFTHLSACPELTSFPLMSGSNQSKSINWITLYETVWIIYLQCTV